MSRATGFRLLKFTAVGAIGVGVQLGALAVLHAMEIAYLPATALAVECAVIHNFLWHRRFTWAERSRSGARGFFMPLFRFHLSNGLISLAGNLLFMRVLVGSCGIALLLANMASIAVCFAVNFLASDRWVFRWP